MQDLKTESTPGAGRASRAEYGSDLIMELFAGLGIPYIALNPGSSYRGIHDSLVNFATPGMPEMVVCQHEEIAVGVAHGYARMTGWPLLAAVHDVVGLQHASMAIFNAWCDRVPLIVIGGTGPAATNNRRAHIDWVHTALVQGNQVRDYTKWDDQPSSVAAFPESIMRAYRITMTEPSGPVYLCFDADLQEQAIDGLMTLPDPKRYQPPAPIAPNPEALEEAARMLASAEHPVILADAFGRHREGLPALESLAELLAAPVISAGRFNIASNHPLNAGEIRQQVLAEADVVLGLDVFDLHGAVGPGISAQRDERQFLNPAAKIIHINVWDLLQHSWVSDYERLAPVDVPIAADSRLAVPQLLELCRRELERDSMSARRIDDRRRALEALQAGARERRDVAIRRGWDARPISLDRLSGELLEVVSANGTPWSISAGRSGWEITDPEQVFGGGRGAGLGMSASASVGATLALKDSGRICINIIGDGDLLYTPQTLWTAANQRLPLLTIVNNNRSYGNDEGHQEYMARTRGRPVENKGVGIFIEDPEPDFASIAKGFNVEGFGPVEDPADLPAVLERAVGIVARERRPILVDVITQRRT
jgi:thiamine pyrophosphate-dependent acetolactate synthase large subunit-like protein